MLGFYLDCSLDYSNFNISNHIFLSCGGQGLTAPKNEKVCSFHVPIHNSYRVGAAGLSIFNYTFKIKFFCDYLQFGPFHVKLIFCQ